MSIKVEKNILMKSSRHKRTGHVRDRSGTEGIAEVQRIARTGVE